MRHSMPECGLPGGEIWINPEVDQGFGLSKTFGVARYPRGEAYKVGDAEPYVLVQRRFLRQTIDLGGETQKLEPDLDQLGGTQTANLLAFTIGKYSIVDIFFDLSQAPNTIALSHGFDRGQFVTELEERHTLWDQPGKL